MPTRRNETKRDDQAVIVDSLIVCEASFDLELNGRLRAESENRKKVSGSDQAEEVRSHDHRVVDRVS